MPTPLSPKQKKGVRSFLRERFDSFRSHLRSPSQQSLEVPGSRANSKSPAPSDREGLSFTTEAGETSSASTGNESTLRRTSSLPLLTLDTPSSRTPIPTLRHVATDFSTGGPSNYSLAGATQTPIANPTLIPSEKPGSLAWTGFKNALEALHETAQLFPPLQLAIGALIPCLDTWELATNNRQGYKNIAQELTALSKSLAQHIREARSLRMSNCIINVTQSIQEQVRLLQEKKDYSKGRRLAAASADEEDLIKHYRKIETLFRQLQTDVNLSTWSIANEQLANTRLEALVPSRSAQHDSSLSTGIGRQTCTEGTRTAILSGLHDWSSDPDAKDIYLMSGMAGTGKTTIACSLSEKLEGRKQLAASFFCSRTSPECRQVQRVIPTIAYQLARYSIPFQVALCEILGNDPDVGSKNIGKQFERLLKEPLIAVKDAIPDNIVVVIDALDECDDRNEVERLLDLLFQSAGDIPLRFFITSRPEPEIYKKMVSQSPGSRTILHLHEIEKSLVQADITLYLTEELGRFMSFTPDQIEQLSQRSGNLFIYASTLVRYLRLGSRLDDHQKRLDSLLAATSHSTKQYAQLDGLYTTVLKSALNEEELDDEEVEDVRAVLQAVICTQEPVNIETLAVLAGLGDAERARSALQPLRSVLHISENNGLISTLHTSFPDFIFSQERSGPFHCDAVIQNLALTRQCFNIMRDQLRFNICDLQSSFMLDQDVPDLPDRIMRCITSSLFYACRYWADHLELCEISGELCSMIDKFTSTYLLFWMEVLNLRGVMGIGSEVLLKARQRLQSNMESTEGATKLVRLAEDARNLVTTFAANPVSQSTPHIYTSLLPFCPKSSSILEHYQRRTRGLIEAKGTGMDRRDAAALACWRAKSSIRSVSYSLDGTRVAFGCKDGTIGIRNAYDGSLIAGPVLAHSNNVRETVFSPDGTRLASCGDDNTIRLWDAQNCLPIGNAFEGHSAPILSISFAYDGARIISGSDDHTVLAWSVSGTPLLAPFRGHTGGVKSVAFSPNGTRVVSGSADCTVRVWNFADGTPVARPFTGHTRWVRSVAFSPDGARIVSGSYDQTVRVWMADDGALVAGPFEGHTDLIMSVAFSPDGRYVASCASDCSVRMWDTRGDSYMAGLFEGHTDSVNVVTFSPDGMHIASGSTDGTIRVWRALALALTSIPPEGHTNWIPSVAFSPDGTRILSSSYDCTIRVWNAQNGAHISNPFHGHTRVVRSVTFSPDSTLIASASHDNTIRVCNALNGTLITKPFKGHNNWVTSIAFSPDGTQIVSGSLDRTIRVWSISNGKRIIGPLNGHSGGVMSVMFSPDGARIVSGSNDRTIRVWNTANGAPIAKPFKGHTRGVKSAAFSPDGALVVSGSEDCTIRLWNAHNGTAPCSPFHGHTAAVYSAAFSPDGAKVISGSDDYTVRLWNSNDGTLIGGPFEGHIDRVWSVAFSPDGASVVSGSNDCTIRVWDTRCISSTGVSVGNSNTPSFQLSTSSPTHVNPFGHWSIKEDGWIKDDDDHLLFWLPPEALRSLITPHCSRVIGRFGSIEVVLSSALLGDRWRECYILE